MKRWLSITVALFAVVYMITESAGSDIRETTSGTSQSVEKTTTINAGNLQIATATPSGNQVPALKDLALKDLAARSPNFNVEWYSINSGGDIMASSANFGSGVSVAQSAAGEATSASYQLNVGFWNGVGGTCCKNPGDANNDGSVNIADVTFLIARIFAGGLAPPCCEQASANGDGSVNIADVTFLIARIFAGGAAPVCGPVGMGC